MTGARPIELRKTTAANYRQGRIIHSAKPGKGYRHKTIRTKRDRVIYMPLEVVPEVEELVQKHPQGPIFLSPRGTPWTKANLHRTWKSLQKQPNVAKYLEDHHIDPKSITPYCYRHSMASQWIDSGRSIHVLAELPGTSVAMVLLFARCEISESVT